MQTKYKYHKDGSLPQDNFEIFVFGSNLAGIHGAGAAKIAKDLFGRPYGTPFGLIHNNERKYGRYFASYGIPTKDSDLRTIDLVRIKQYVESLRELIIQDLEESSSGGEMKWFFTRIGCGLAGYKDEQIAPMFENFPFPCNFPIEWKQYLER